MKTNELREKYLDFFKGKGHKIVQSASLIPENDPTTLFTSSGMQPMVPYLLGETHPEGTRLTDSQKCFRTQDIEDVGDNRHTTFFEMLGNWSLGDYFKDEQISWMFEFLTQELKLDPKRLYITVFGGKQEIDIPRDEEAVKIWQEKFKSVNLEAEVSANVEEQGIQPGERIFYYDEYKNWWSRAGVTDSMPVGEPGGPDSEMFWDFDPKGEFKIHENSEFKDQPCHPNCDCGRFVEIGNNVFMQYLKTENGFEPLPKNNVDFGGGLERLVAAVVDTPDIFKIDVFQKAIKTLEELSGKKYGQDKKIDESFRVVLDHFRAAVFLVNDGALPSNKDQGYFTRRLIRRAIRFADKLNVADIFAERVVQSFISEYKEAYPELETNKVKIIEEINKEEVKFRQTLKAGLKELNRFVEEDGVNFFEKNDEHNTWLVKKFKYEDLAKVVFDLFQSYGFPLELSYEELLNKQIRFDKDILSSEFKKEFEKHQEVSRAGAEQKFKGGLADTAEETCDLHTATHLLHAALRQVLGSEVQQRGSNITADRLRFDFNYPEKLTQDQINQVEELVNKWISQGFDVVCQEMDYTQAKEMGATGLFTDKYGEKVKIYSIGNVSCEMCGGPHAGNTSDLGKFKIKKEESSSAGVRRIKAILGK